MPGKVALTVVAGPLRGRTFQFDGHDTFLFGRSPDCHAELAAEDTTASRHHFLLEVNPPAARLRDLGSLNGTWVNATRYGGRAREAAPSPPAAGTPEVDLRHGDQIRVGSTVFSVAIDAPVTCCGCGALIAAADEAASRWLAGTFLCAGCRARSGASGKPQPRSMPPAATGHAAAGAAVAVSQPKPEAGAGAEVPGYELQKLLGKGGMGAVHLARRVRDGRTVALKVMLPQVVVDERAREIFNREIEVTRSLRHPNIVELFEHGSVGDGFYFAMEYCAGGSVTGLMRARGAALERPLAVRIALQTLEGLAYAHEAGFVHRDIKPENLLATDAQASAVKVTDFGLAKSFQQAGLSGMTATGTVAGTLFFMPREQLTNFRLMKPASDVWSTGASLYFMLTGRYARDFGPGRDPLQVILQGGVVPIRERDPALPPGLAAVIDRAVADSLDERFPTAAEFRDALAAAL